VVAVPAVLLPVSHVLRQAVAIYAVPAFPTLLVGSVQLL
jgi:hypothetical protein